METGWAFTHQQIRGWIQCGPSEDLGDRVETWQPHWAEESAAGDNHTDLVEKAQQGRMELCIVGLHPCAEVGLCDMRGALDAS